MIIDHNAFNGFVKPKRVGESVDFKNRPANIQREQDLITSVSRQRAAYSSLPEVRAGVIFIGPVFQNETGIWFDVNPGPHYSSIAAAVRYMLVWDTNIDEIDYPRSIERWQILLDRNTASVKEIATIRSNNLHQPHFAEFHITLIEYLLSCEEFGGRYIKMKA